MRFGYEEWRKIADRERLGEDLAQTTALIMSYRQTP